MMPFRLFTEAMQRDLYIRFGDLPMANGKIRRSTNYAYDKKEPGLSVYPAYFDVRIKKYVMDGDEEGLWNGTSRPVYLLTGTDAGAEGSDEGEVLLDIDKPIRIIKRLSLDDIVTTNVPYITYGNTELDMPDGVHDSILKNFHRLRGTQ
jgi:hypothetical protein